MRLSCWSWSNGWYRFGFNLNMMAKAELSYSDFKNSSVEILNMVNHHLRIYQDDDELWKFMVVDFKHLRKIEKLLPDNALLIYADLDLLGSSISRLELECELIQDLRFWPMLLNSQGAVVVYRDGDL